MLLLIILAYTAIFSYELIPLYKQKLWSDFYANVILGVSSFIAAALLSFDIRIPSPEEPIRVLITSIFGK